MYKCKIYLELRLNAQRGLEILMACLIMKAEVWLRTALK